MNDPEQLTPDRLAARYETVRRRSNTISLAPDRWADLEARSMDRPWGVGAFCHHDGRVLLVCEQGEWMLPGGVLEPGESPETGARREVREETGVVATIEGLGAISKQTFVNETTDDRFDFHFATFVASTTDPATSADPGLAGEGIETVEWVERIPENTFERDLVRALSRSVIG